MASLRAREKSHRQAAASLYPGPAPTWLKPHGPTASGSCPPPGDPAPQRPPSPRLPAAHTRGLRAPPGPGSDAGSPCGLPSSSGAAARWSPPENRSPLRLPRDLLFECRPRKTQSPASCAIGTGGLTGRGQRAAGRPQRSALGPAWQDAGGNRPGRPGPEPVGHVTPSAYASATAPSGGGRHGSESRPCHRLPGRVTPESPHAASQLRTRGACAPPQSICSS